jgi:DnaJ-class molecular chaperone
MERNYYRILGVSEVASHDEVHQAYRRLARLYHPDSSGAEASARFRDVQEAWDTLGDEQRRQEYDARRLRCAPLSAGGPDILGGPWSEDAGPTATPGGGAVLHLELWLDPAEVRRGGLLPVDLPAFVPCPWCAGTGTLYPGPCRPCRGAGYCLGSERFVLQVPAGLFHGQVVQIPLHDWELYHRVLVLHVRVTA